LYSKPALIAGFSLLMAGHRLWAQDYIDVEAGDGVAQPQRVEVITRAASPQGEEAADTVSPASPAVVDYSVSGVRPYSGQTTQLTPIAEQSSGEPNVGSIVVQLQLLQEEVRRLTGLVEEQAQQLARLKEQSLERYVDLDRRLASAAEEPLIGSQGGAGSEGQVAEVAMRPTLVVTPKEAGEEVAYQSAYSLVKTRQFPEAVEAFKTFLGGYPFGYYAPNAHYWLGELYLVLEKPDPELARQSFKLLLDQYPDNAKVPDATYKLGRVHFLKANRDRAREYLNRVISEYPDHPAAQLAQDFIRDNF